MICYIAIDGSFKLGGCVAFQTSSFEMPETFNQCREVYMYGSELELYRLFIISIYLKAHLLIFSLSNLWLIPQSEAASLRGLSRIGKKQRRRRLIKFPNSYRLCCEIKAAFVINFLNTSYRKPMNSIP
jgi:hypothetical protein